MTSALHALRGGCVTYAGALMRSPRYQALSTIARASSGGSGVRSSSGRGQDRVERRVEPDRVGAELAQAAAAAAELLDPLPDPVGSVPSAAASAAIARRPARVAHRLDRPRQHRRVGLRVRDRRGPDERLADTWWSAKSAESSA